MNAAQVRAKARMAMKRREEEIEQEEIEGGELNLVPYLDIVTNIMLFLLATITVGLILGQINTALPDFISQGAGGAKPQTPEEQPLQLVLSVDKQKARLWSLSGLEGSLEKPIAEVSSRPGICPDDPKSVAKKPDKKPSCVTLVPGRALDFEPITKKLLEIVDRRGWKGKAIATRVGEVEKCVVQVRDEQTGKVKPTEKPLAECRPERSGEMFLVMDGDLKYDVVVGAMDAVRSAEGQVLFPGIIFSTGFE